MNSKRNKKIVLVVAHDAGGAEVIAAYVRRNRARAHYMVFAAGPAKRIFARNGISTMPAPRTSAGMRALLRKNRFADLALLGTGWMTRIEANALKESKHAGVRAAVYLDSWMNYREVFGYPKRGWRKNLPDEFWAGDAAAISLAKQYFPRTPIHHVPNGYFEDIKARHRANKAKHRAKEGILYMSAAGVISETILDNMLKELDRERFNRIVRIRLHPADERARFESICSRWRNVPTEISHYANIVDDIGRARLVIGPETVALVPALFLKIPAIRIVPKGTKAFLPFRQIRKVSRVQQAVGMILREVSS